MIMKYAKSAHRDHDRRFHIVWVRTYCYKVLLGNSKYRVRDICGQVCDENGVDILHGVISKDYAHLFVAVRPRNSQPPILPAR